MSLTDSGARQGGTRAPPRVQFPHRASARMRTLSSSTTPRITKLDTVTLVVMLLLMNFVTLEVELDHGRVIPKGSERLPDKASALLTILPASTAAPRDPHPG